MDNIIVKVNDYVSCNKGVTPDEGQPIYDRLMGIFKDGNRAVLDFSGVEIATTGFLNVFIGNLYRTYTSDDLKGMLELENVSPSTAFRIKKVTDNAKSFYRDEEKYNESVESVLNENS